jgi:hypothetical protein
MPWQGQSACSVVVKHPIVNNIQGKKLHLNAFFKWKDRLTTWLMNSQA